MGIPLPPEAVREGIAATRWPGRLAVLAEDPVTVVDGAHNPVAGEALATALRRLLPGRPVALVLGMATDKHAEDFVRSLRSAVTTVWVVPIAGDRNMAPERLCAALRTVGLDPQPARNLGAGLAQAREWARIHDGAVCITGSLFLAGEALARAGSGNLEIPGAR
jgi:dihydrofolate synthase/folylpolyglutamate synthase